MLTVEHFGIASTFAIAISFVEMSSNIALEKLMVQSKHGRMRKRRNTLPRLPLALAASPAGHPFDRRLRSCCQWNEQEPSHKPDGKGSGLTSPVPEAAAKAMDSDVLAIHPSELHGHRHRGQRLLSLGPWKQMIAPLGTGQIVEKCKDRLRQGHPMVLTRFHAIRRYGPGSRFQIKFLPNRVENFTGSAGR